MTRIFFVRHGQTIWNKEKIFRGSKDVPLSELGLKEAEAMGRGLADSGITKLYSSPLQRSIQTLTPLSKILGLPIEPLPGVTDLCFGEWEGKPLAQVMKEDPERYRQFQEEPEKVVFPGGESLAQARERAMNALHEVATKHPDETLAICSHRVICKLVILGLFGVSNSLFWSVMQDTACVNLFDYSPPKFVIRKINDTSHLKGLEGLLSHDF